MNFCFFYLGGLAEPEKRDRRGGGKQGRVGEKRRGKKGEWCSRVFFVEGKEKFAPVLE